MARPAARPDDAVRRQHRADDRRGRDQFVRAALARHLAARRLDDDAGTPRRGRNSSSAIVLWVTVEVVLAVVFLSLLIGVPAAYTLARRNFRGKRAADAAVPAAADGAADHLRHSARDGAVQGASRRHDLGRDPRQPDSGGAVRHPGDDAVHRADRPEPRIGGARVRRRAPAACSGTCWCRCWRPASSPRRCSCWCARSRCSSSRSSRPAPDSQTLVVALYYAVFAAGVRAPQSVDAMAMVYMAVTLVWLLIALRFVNPTQLVSRVKEHPQPA